MSGLVKRLKYFSLTTSMFGILAQPVFYAKASQSSSPTLILSFAGFLGLVAVMTPIILNILTKRYITQLYFDHEKKVFTSYTLSLLNRRRCTTFTASDVTLPPLEGPFTSFKVFNKPYLVDPAQFSERQVYEHLMGYDKPLEQEISSTVSREDEVHVASEKKEAKKHL
ncbi:Transmembrane protein 70 -like protein, mitochondrial [Halotydeus destructor]|nr:Transmembrane protein 70 -like protein, mitochondrial [Halotydeus destructor]